MPTYHTWCPLISSNVADINPIGGISKTDLKRFIAYARDAFDLPILDRHELIPQFLSPLLTTFISFLTAVPTAELEPITETYVQADEARISVPLKKKPLYFISLVGGHGNDIRRIVSFWPYT